MYFVTLALDVSQYTKKKYTIYNPNDDGNKNAEKMKYRERKIIPRVFVWNIERDRYERRIHLHMHSEYHTQKKSQIVTNAQHMHSVWIIECAIK